MLFTNRDKEYIASESRMREEIPGGRRQKETFCTFIWAGKDKRSAGDTNIPADLTIRITQVRVYRRPQHGSWI